MIINTKIKNIIWSIYMTIKLIRKHGVSGAEAEITRQLNKERMKYWRLTGKHPSEKYGKAYPDDRS